ncbi:beta-ketoacyl-ACP synthase III [Nocardia sp. BMG51109]|uniref:beta-ketoacyl-ACP synthase III n=1 Tax=Nocardia sp. BMG51109 TaxID=1056816 RepID=UPI000463B55D|nr:beta-ketoacyl-ACP synthase III [Nocardia sp. BMG51109]
MPVDIAPTQTPTLPHTAILGLGVYRPGKVVTNDEIAVRLNSSDEWIQQRSGIRSRRYCEEEETLFDISVAAAQQAMKSAGVGPEDIDCLVLATMTHQFITPAAAPLIATQLGIENAAAFDLINACAGFCAGLTLASDMVRAGTMRKVLVIGAEKFGDLVDMDDRSTAFLFGDGAGAVVVGPSEDVGIGPTVWGSDGTNWTMLGQDKGFFDWAREVQEVGREAKRPYFTMNGPALFRWAVGSVEKICREALDRAKVPIEDLDALILHQANGRITEAVARMLNVPDDCTVANDIVEQGNTSAASVPLAMEGVLRDGTAKPGDVALLIGFGAGLTYTAQVVKLPGVPQ